MHDVIIIGAGPAGYTAGIYCARARHDTLLISGILPGGQLMNTTDVENYPGFSDGIMGPDLMTVMRSEEHTSELQSLVNLVCRLLLEKKKNIKTKNIKI